MPTLEDAIQHIRMGSREHGRQMLEEILETDETNEDVWLWLSAAVESDEDREICLENVLALNPDNVIAQRGLDALHTGTFNPNDLLADLIEQGEQTEEEAPDATFLDDFVVSDDEEEDDLEFPGTMTGPTKKRSKKSAGGLNIRIVILIVLVIGVVLVLGGIAAYSIFIGTTEAEPGQVENQPGQQQPQPEPTEEPTATHTPEPIPTATNTPIPTRTPFALPTPRPRDEPSPTATQVVSPTPAR